MKSSKRSSFIILPLGLALFAASSLQLLAAEPTRVAAVTLSWADKDRTLAHTLEMLDRAAKERAQIVCLPQECVPTDGGAVATAALEAIRQAAAKAKFYVVANLKEQADGKTFLTSYLIGPDGAVAGKYRKSHRLPDEAIALGDKLPVFDTPFGKVGLMIGTDLYWPEVPLVLALKGAELVLCSSAPEPVPQSAPTDVLTRTRAFDDHVTFAYANYASDLPYLCSNHPTYTGSPLGRGCVIDRSGIVLADTGIRAGVAVAVVDLKRPTDVYQLTFHEDRSLFRQLVERDIKPLVAKPQKRRITVSIAQVFMSHGPNPKPDSEFAKILDAAGARGSDVILMSEFGFATDTPVAEKTFALVAEKARKYRSYIIIGGLRDPAMPGKNGKATSWAYLWDREGRVVGKYRISQYGGSKELLVFATDFGVIGIILCGDIYSQEITRALALQGAEIVFCPSQSWGPSGVFNRWMQEARALDNSVWMAAAHFPMSDISQRSYVIDPYGHVVSATPYWSEGVATTEIDLDAGRVWFARSDKPGPAGKPGYLHAYFPKFVPERRTDFRAVLFAGRRPELYSPIIEKTLADRDTPLDLKDRMGVPR
ncbi:MAG: carbon-nitrogen hydrolase family protein [Verrucomicrobia bacterium]|nr:carbon-nitrogen hydrolase family protein [Verrucomicrobiota bacterium]